MRIVLDMSAVRSTGMRNYLRGFLPALGRVAEGHDFLVYVPQSELDELAPQLPARFELRAHAFTHVSAVRLLWQQTVLPAMAAVWRADVLFAPFDVAPLAAGCPVVLAVRNPSPIMEAQGVQRRSLFAHVRARVQRFVSALSARRASTVFYPTAYAAQEVGGAVGVPAAKRRVVNHGSDVSFWTSSRSATLLEPYHLSPGRYLLYVSNFYRSKRPDVLVRAFAQLRKEQAHSDLALALVGGVFDAAYHREVQRLAVESNVATHVKFLGHVPREDVAALYQHAALFVLPTQVETFCFPFVEAMAAGAPVVAPDLAFAHEVCGPAARYVSIDDTGSALSACVGELLADPDARKRMTALGRERALLFDWGLEAQRTLALLIDGAHHDAPVVTPREVRR